VTNARALLLLLAALALPARAEAPCVVDAARLCPGVPAAGDGRLWACLLRNETQLSSACVRNIQEVRRRAGEFNVDCAGDVFRFCPGTRPGQGRVLECLGAWVGKRELSSTCEAAVATALENVNEFAAACGDEAARHCPGIQPGSGRIFLCLRAQSERLSTRCQRALNPR
jgi:Golgi apparatus protein 1